MQILNDHEISSVSGGNWFFFVLELPHILMGLREFVNYAADRAIYGCTNIDEGDYITHFVCGILSNEK